MREKTGMIIFFTVMAFSDFCHFTLLSKLWQISHYKNVSRRFEGKLLYGQLRGNKVQNTKENVIAKIH